MSFRLTQRQWEWWYLKEPRTITYTTMEMDAETVPKLRAKRNPPTVPTRYDRKEPV